MSKTSDKINARLKRIGATRYALAKRCGKDRDTVYDICSGLRDPRTSTVEAIEAALTKMEKEAEL